MYRFQATLENYKWTYTNLFDFFGRQNSARRSAADWRFSGRRLLDAADHDLDEARLLPVLERLFARTGILEKQVSHALPVLHHRVGLDERVDEVRAVLVKLRLDEELNLKN
jgi:hypothetical protein